MESHLQSRPKKTLFALAEQHRLRALAIEKVQRLFLSDEGIRKIILMGSSVKGTFGAYGAPGFRGSLFSDFDFIFFVKDDYVIPSWLESEPDGKPFGKEELDLAYRQKKLVEDTYDAEIFFIREKHLHDQDVRLLAENAGIPLDDQSRSPFMTVWEDKVG